VIFAENVEKKTNNKNQIKMNNALEEKMKYLKQEAESDMLYNRDRMYDNPDTDVTYYERKYAESKAYYKGIMDTLNLIAQDQAK
tara:strand:+ start:351 stop:602 length:252 start_codon:yes stop_codon:yes gene_type:complete